MLLAIWTLWKRLFLIKKEAYCLQVNFVSKQTISFVGNNHAKLCEQLECNFKHFFFFSLFAATLCTRARKTYIKCTDQRVVRLENMNCGQLNGFERAGDKANGPKHIFAFAPFIFKFNFVLTLWSERFIRIFTHSDEPDLIVIEEKFFCDQDCSFTSQLNIFLDRS